MLEEVVDSIYPESQCGFIAGRGAADMILAMRHLQEKCREKNLDRHMAFIDLTKARDGLWTILQRLGYPERFVSIIRSFHEGMIAESL